MWRIAVVACVTACFALPATGRADTPGYTRIGPPSALTGVVFASDGTVYGTRDRDSFEVRPILAPAVWQSTDHGRTWNAVFRAQGSATLAAVGASPTAVYVTDSRSANQVQRIDPATGRATGLAIGTFAGVDAAQTAYGFGFNGSSTGFNLERCPQSADHCDALPLPPGFEPQVAVDPNSVGVLAVRLTAGQANLTYLFTSTDGGASWAPGAALDYNCRCPLAFAGPGTRTLYVMNGGQLSVSHDAGLTFDANPTTPPYGSGLIVGSQPDALVEIDPGGGEQLFRTSDGGASFQAATLPGSYPVVDPTDPTHAFFLHATAWEGQTRDSGQSWSSVEDPRFGIADLDTNNVSGSGQEIYVPGAFSSIWHSDDMGTTWSRTATPDGGYVGEFLVSRDDPRIAYTHGQPAGSMRTVDGGATWQLLPVTMPPVAPSPLRIGVGHPTHLLAHSGQTYLESLDAGSTWIPAPAGALCTLAGTGNGQVGCSESGTPPVPLASPLPEFAFGLFDAPDDPGADAVAYASLIGDVGANGSLSSSLAPAGGSGPPAGLTGAAAAWPAADGSTLYGFDGAQSVTWVRRGQGRWWRLQEAGHKLDLIAPLDRTHALVSFRDTSIPPYDWRSLGVLDLAHPAVDQPIVQAQGNVLTCAVPWSASDADTSAYAWFRDGKAVPNATASQLKLGTADGGREITCRATARNDWGSTALMSSNVFEVPGARAASSIHLRGSALFGHRLRCAATAHIAWLRNGRIVANRHARTYLVGPADEDHALACRGTAPDGTIARSPALRVPKAHGGRAVPVTLTP